MTRQQTLQVFSLIKAAYPQYKLTEQETENAAAVWMTLLGQYDINEIKQALLQYMIEQPDYVPTAPKILSMMAKPMEVLPCDLWHKIVHAMEDAGYHATAMFNQMPQICKDFVGSPMRLRDMALDENEYSKEQTRKRFEDYCKQLKESGRPLYIDKQIGEAK